MSYLSTRGNLSVNTELLKDIKVNNEYSTLEFYYMLKRNKFTPKLTNYKIK